jgi:hypothetical protein
MLWPSSKFFVQIIKILEKLGDGMEALVWPILMKLKNFMKKEQTYNLPKGLWSSYQLGILPTNSSNTLEKN